MFASLTIQHLINYRSSSHFCEIALECGKHEKWPENAKNRNRPLMSAEEQSRRRIFRHRIPDNMLRCFLVIAATHNTSNIIAIDTKREHSWISFVSLSVNKILEVVVSKPSTFYTMSLKHFSFPSSIQRHLSSSATITQYLSKHFPAASTTRHVDTNSCSNHRGKPTQKWNNYKQYFDTL